MAINYDPIVGDISIPLTWLVTGDGGTGGVTGLTTTVAMRRVADGFYLDRADDDFKDSGWTTRQKSLTEIDATNSPGVYEDIWNSSLSITAPGDYYAEYQSTTAGKLAVAHDYLPFRLATATQLLEEPMAGHTTVGTFGNYIQTLRMFITNRLELADGDTGNWILYKDDGTTVHLTWPVKDKTGTTISLVSKAPARQGAGVPTV